MKYIKEMEKELEEILKEIRKHEGFENAVINYDGASIDLGQTILCYLGAEGLTIWPDCEFKHWGEEMCLHQPNKSWSIKPPKPKSFWDLKEGDIYYYKDIDLEIMEDVWENHSSEFELLAAGNVFLTEDDCGKDIEKQKATVKVKKRIAELNDGWTPDWNDNTQPKHYIEYSYISKKLVLEFWNRIKTIDNGLYLKSQALCRQLIAEMEEELKVMLEVGL